MKQIITEGAMDMDDMMALLLIFITACLILVYRKSKGESGSGYKKDIPLNPGTYRIGEDFPPGKGDFVAIEGKGELIFKRWGAEKYVMKATLQADGTTAPDRYRNLTLSPHDTLEVTGNLKIMITPARAFSENVTPILTLGTYQFGKDIPPAKYNLKVSGDSGTVRYYEPDAEEPTFTQEMGGDGQGTLYENLLCAEKGRMTIEGKLKLELTKSKKQPSTRMQKVLDFLNQTP